MPNNNGRVGQYGISWNGWEVSMGMIDAHPALKASSPQAPPQDQFMGDDYHSGGAYQLMYGFNWMSTNARARSGPSGAPVERFDYGTTDGYRFFLDLGAAANAQKCFADHVPTWNDHMAHGTTAGYHRRTYANLAVTDNRNVGVDDWSPFTITAPRDARLPNGGGYPITLYTLNPIKVGVATANLRTFSALNSRVYNGLDVTVNARVRDAGFLLGGIIYESTVSNTCDQRDNPNDRRFCDAVGPFRTSFKLSGSYELPLDVQVAGSLLMRPGGDIAANDTVTSAIAGRPIVTSTAGASQMTVTSSNRTRASATTSISSIYESPARFASDAIGCRDWWTSTTSSTRERSRR